MTEFVKHSAAAPEGYFAWEAAGLAWLGAAAGGVPCAGVRFVDAQRLTLEHLVAVAPTRAAAVEFGHRLARTHDAGAQAFGSAPAGWHGDGFFGPLHQPMPMSLRAHDHWGRFYADERLLPMAALARVPSALACELDTVVTRCRAGEFDDCDSPARIHGDLWSGNLMWTRDGVFLIDPAAHGGHRETDLAMLALFGCPHLDAVHDGYQQVRPLRTGWRSRVGLHQLYPLLAHVALFGSSYLGQLRAAVRSVAEFS